MKQSWGKASPERLLGRGRIPSRIGPEKFPLSSSGICGIPTWRERRFSDLAILVPVGFAGRRRNKRFRASWRHLHLHLSYFSRALVMLSLLSSFSISDNIYLCGMCTDLDRFPILATLQVSVDKLKSIPSVSSIAGLGISWVGDLDISSSVT
jgi:hypothetical protein